MKSLFYNILFLFSLCSPSQDLLKDSFYIEVDKDFELENKINIRLLLDGNHELVLIFKNEKEKIKKKKIFNHQKIKIESIKEIKTDEIESFLEYMNNRNLYVIKSKSKKEYYIIKCNFAFTPLEIE